MEPTPQKPAPEPAPNSTLMIYAVLSVILIFTGIMAIQQRRAVWITASFLGLIYTFIPMILTRKWGVVLPIALQVGIVIAVLVHVGGGAFFLYWNIPYYDDMAQGSNPGIIHPVIGNALAVRGPVEADEA